MSTSVPRSSQDSRSSTKDSKPITVELEALKAAEVEENLPSSRKVSKTSAQIKVEFNFEAGDENGQMQVENEALEDGMPEEAADNLEDDSEIPEEEDEEEQGTGSLQGSVASVAASEPSAAGETRPKSLNKSDKKLKIAFSEPESFAQSTSSNYRVTRMFDSITVSRRRQSSVAPKPVLKFQPSYRLESSHPFNALAVEDLTEKFVENRMKEVGKIDFANHKQVQKTCEKMSFDILQEIKAKEYDRYKILVNVTIVEKFHQGFRGNIGCLWDSETDAMALNVYDRHDLFVITIVFGIYYD